MVSANMNDTDTANIGQPEPSSGQQGGEPGVQGPDRDKIVKLADDLVGDTDEMYHEHQIPKSDGSMRELEEPKPKLKEAQNIIKEHILYRIKPHDRAFGFIRNRNLVKAAIEHVGRPLVIRVDIKSFFHNNTRDKLEEKFDRYFEEEDFDPLTMGQVLDLMTRYDRLPMGAPSSPPATNIVARSMDSRINKLCRREEEDGEMIEIGGNTTPKHDYVYTRYADDLVISTTDATDDPEEPDGTQIIPKVRSIVEDEGFELREKKTRIMRDGSRQTVLGLTVNVKPNIPEEVRENFRARLDNIYKDLKSLRNGEQPERDESRYDWPEESYSHPYDIETDSVLDKGVVQQLAGFIAHALDVNDTYGERWEKKLDEITRMARQEGYLE